MRVIARTVFEPREQAQRRLVHRAQILSRADLLAMRTAAR
jgi:hypothetical protein